MTTDRRTPDPKPGLQTGLKTGSLGALILAIALAAPIGLAVASESYGSGGVTKAPGIETDTLGLTAEEIRTALTAAGYDVIEIERENGTYEATARRDGERWEFYVDAATGKIRKSEREDW